VRSGLTLEIVHNTHNATLFSNSPKAKTEHDEGCSDDRRVFGSSFYFEARDPIMLSCGEGGAAAASPHIPALRSQPWSVRRPLPGCRRTITSDLRKDSPK
jgi:hypothetical protein